MQKLDFSETCINHWSVEVTPEVAIDHLAYSIEAMKRFLQEDARGQVAGYSPTPLTFEKWRELHDAAYGLWRDFPATESIKVILTMVVERGIKSLVATALVYSAGVDQNEETRETIRRWFTALSYQMDPPALGIGSKVCSQAKTYELMDELVMVGLHMKDEYMIATIAGKRHLGDEFGQRLYVQHFTKDW
jgi:hypothetical protein